MRFLTAPRRSGAELAQSSQSGAGGAELILERLSFGGIGQSSQSGAGGAELILERLGFGGIGSRRAR